jgi:hypothetical protein
MLALTVGRLLLEDPLEVGHETSVATRSHEPLHERLHHPHHAGQAEEIGEVDE